MSVLCLTPNRNSPHKRDYTGAFLPLAERLVDFHGGRISKIDTSKTFKGRVAETLAAIESARSIKKLDTVAFCCHGWPSGIQLGFDRSNVSSLASTIAQICTKARVVLYACSTGAKSKKGPADGDGSFADLLRDQLCLFGAVDCRVVGHTTAGRAAENPFVRLFDGLGSPIGGHGGTWIVAPKSPLWGRWKAALEDTDLRLKFPWMSIAEIHEGLLR